MDTHTRKVKSTAKGLMSAAKKHGQAMVRAQLAEWRTHVQQTRAAAEAMRDEARKADEMADEWEKRIADYESRL